MHLRRIESQEAGLKYFVLGAIASGMLLYGMSILYGLSGSLQISEIADAVMTTTGGQADNAQTIGMIFALVFIVVALAFKLGAVPFHMWTPDVYEGAPAPVTAFMSAAVKAAGLVETLKGDGPFTVFAPTDEAFAKLPEGTVDTLLQPENQDQLVAILTYHVVPAKVMASDVASGQAPTVNGKPLSVSVSSKGVMVGDAMARPLADAWDDEGPFDVSSLFSVAILGNRRRRVPAQSLLW